MILNTKDYNPNYQISKNFKLKELASPDGYIIFNYDVLQFIQAIQDLRTFLKRPIYPSSWYRTKKHNISIGGSKTSMHLKALAIDIPNYPNMDIDAISNQWRIICQTYNQNGSIEICDKHFHLDFKKWSDNKFHIYYGKSK